MAIGDLEPSVWRLEVYEMHPSDTTSGIITDLSNLYTSDLTINKQRNYPDEIKFTLDLQQLEERAKSLDVQSREILEPYKHKIRCYRNNKFMAQGIVTKVTANLNNQSKNTLEVQCVDTLGLLEKRLIHQDYGEGSWADFAKEVVMDAQHEPNRIYNYAWEGDGTSIDNAWFRGWKYTPGELALRNFPEWEPNHLYSMYDTCTHDAKFWEAKESAFYSGETFSESNWTLLGILDAETGDVAGVYGVWREDDEEPGPTGTALGGWGGTSSCHMTADTFLVNNAGSISSISMMDSCVSTSLVSPYIAKQSIPKEYQQVEYIEGDANQSIDTLFSPTQSTTIQAKFMVPQSATSPLTLLSTSDQTTPWILSRGTLNGYSLQMSSQTISSSNGACAANIPQEIELGNLYIKTINSLTNDIASGTSQTFSNDSNIILGTLRWYYVKIFDNGELVRYLVPCYRKSDSIVGMFDTVEKKFYTNTNDGVFTKGENFAFGAKLPQEYVEVQYLENPYGATNTSQSSPYIDTLLNARAYGERIKIDTVLQFLSNTDFSSTHCIASVSRGLYSGTWYWNPQFNFCIDSNGRACLEYSTSSATYNSTASSVTGSSLGSLQHHIIVDATKNTPSISVDGTEFQGSTARASGSKYGANATIAIFARNYQTPDTSPSGVASHRRGAFGASMRLYSMKIYDSNGLLLRDFVPCIRSSDGKAGLYEMANGYFYANSNTSAVGDFVAGPAIPDDTQFKLERDRRNDMSMGDYRAIQGIDTDILFQKFKEEYPAYAQTHYAPTGVTFIGVAGGYTCELGIGAVGSSSPSIRETIWTGTTIEAAAEPLAAWGLTIFKTSVWEQ